MNDCLSKFVPGVCLSGFSSIKGLRQIKKNTTTREREVPQKEKSAATDRVLSCF